jgi:hypothetical protein
MVEDDHVDPALGPGTLQFVLSIERAGETISGQVGVAGGSATSFFGWLELIAQLEREIAGDLDRSGAGAADLHAGDA